MGAGKVEGSLAVRTLMALSRLLRSLSVLATAWVGLVQSPPARAEEGPVPGPPAGEAPANSATVELADEGGEEGSGGEHVVEADSGPTDEAKMEAAKAEEKRLRQERIVAFARRRVQEMAERQRAAVRAAARAQAAEKRRVSAARKAASRQAAAEVVVPLPEIVDHRSALERQLAAHWGWGADKDRQVRVPLPDWQNWQRVRLFGVEHVTAFRYTKQHHTLTAVFSVETRAERPSSLSCMDEFERRGFPELRKHGVHIEPIDERTSRWDERPVLVHRTDGRVTFLFTRYEFSAAWTAYPAYDHGCLVYATVVLWDGEPELARRVLDRFVAEGVEQVRPLTDVLPGRREDASAPSASDLQRAMRTSP